MNDYTNQTNPGTAPFNPPGPSPSPLANDRVGLPNGTLRPSDREAGAVGSLNKAVTAVSDQAKHLASDIRARSQKVAEEASQMAHEVKVYVVRHPMASAFTAIGVSLVAGFALYELLKPKPTPKSRAMDMLRDIRASLADLAESTADRAKDMTNDGTKAVKRGYNAVSESRWANQLRDLFA